MIKGAIRTLHPHYFSELVFTNCDFKNIGKTNK